MNDSYPVGAVNMVANYGRGASSGLRAGALSSFKGMPTLEALDEEHAIDALGTSAQGTVPGGSILAAGLVFVGLLVLLMYAAKHGSGGEGKEFASLRPSAYNVLVVALAAIVGIPILKFGFAKVPIPAVQAWVSAV